MHDLSRWFWGKLLTLCVMKNKWVIATTLRIDVVRLHWPWLRNSNSADMIRLFGSEEILLWCHCQEMAAFCWEQTAGLQLVVCFLKPHCTLRDTPAGYDVRASSPPLSLLENYRAILVARYYTPLGVGSGVTKGLSQGGRTLAEGGPLITVGGPLANTQKKSWEIIVNL